MSGNQAARDAASWPEPMFGNGRSRTAADGIGPEILANMTAQFRLTACLAPPMPRERA
jgi:hypothetical protein